MRDTEREREREAETLAEGEAGSMQGAQCGTRSRVSRITPWAEVCAKPLSHPGCPGSTYLNSGLIPTFPLLFHHEGEVYSLEIPKHGASGLTALRHD